MWTSRSRPELNDDSDSIFDVRSAVDFPTTHLQPLGLPDQKEQQLPPAPPKLSANFATRLAVDRNAHRKGESLGQRARRAAHRLWPGGALAFIADLDDATSMSMPSDTMSLSTVTDSTISDRFSVQPSLLNVRAEPINDAERHALNRMAMAHKPTLADPDTIIHDLLRLDLGNDEVEHLMTQISAVGPNMAHIREREFKTVLDRVNDDDPDPSPSSSAQPRSERQPVTVAGILQKPISPKLQLNMDSQSPQRDGTRVDSAPQRPFKFSSTAILPFGSSRDEIKSPLTSSSSTKIKEEPTSPQPVACFQPAISSPGGNSSLLNQDDIKTASSDPPTPASAPPPEQVALCNEECPTVARSIRESDEESDRQSLSSGYFSDDNITNIGNYAAKQVFGDDFENTISRSVLDEAVQCFIDLLILGRDTVDSTLHSESLSDGNEAQPDSSSTTNSGVAGASSLKRKAAAQNGFRQGYRETGEDDDDDEIGHGQDRRGNGRDRPTGETGNEIAKSPIGRLEFMCPFRLKDRFRFNVRDWYECATKAYICEGKKNELNELR